MISPALLLTLDEYSSWRAGRVVPMIHSAAEDRFNDGRVELFQQLLWQVELPQLEKEVPPLLGVPIQVLRNYGAQEPECLHCSHSAVHDGKWGRAGGLFS